MKGLAPLSYWLAWVYYRWATSRRFGRVRPTHPDAAKIGERIYHYERLLGIQGKKNLVRL